MSTRGALQSVLQKVRRNAASNESGTDVRQHYKYDCGAACLASVAAFYGTKASLAHIRILCGCTPQGISMQGIIDGAHKLGFVAKGYKSETKELQQLIGVAVPIIAHIKDNTGFYHFVTIYNVDETTLQIMDPSQGRRLKCLHKEFTESWTGYIITIAPGTGSGKSNGYHSSTSRHLLALLTSNLREVALAFAGSITITFAGLGITFLLQQLIDNIVPQGNNTAMLAMGALAFSLMLLSLYIGYCTAGYLIRCSLKLETSLTARYVEKIFSLPQEFFENYLAGDISSRRDDINSIRSFITNGVIGIATSMITIVASLVVMFIYNHRLALWITLFIPAYWGLYKLSGHIYRKFSKDIACANASLETSLLEGISGVPAIRYYGAHHIAIGKIERNIVHLAGKLNSSANAMNLFETAVQGVSKLLVCLILTVGAAAVLGGEMSIGELVGFYSICTFFTVPLNSLIETSRQISGTKVSCERIFEILDLPDESSPTDGISPDMVIGNISLHSVGFRFPGRENLLQDVSFAVPQGKITLIKGESGCGKSTIAKLLLRERVPGNGKICYAGVDISLFNLQQWRDMIGYVPQESSLLNATILENITLRRDGADIERALEICSMLNMTAMIQRFPLGLLTPAGQEGNGLSGGECQKIAIARALYKDAQIYIFDEVTSSLDPVSEKYVLAAMANLREKGKTVIFITHKDTGNSIADNVVTIN